MRSPGAVPVCDPEGKAATAIGAASSSEGIAGGPAKASSRVDCWRLDLWKRFTFCCSKRCEPAAEVSKSNHSSAVRKSGLPECQASAQCPCN